MFCGERSFANESGKIDVSGNVAFGLGLWQSEPQATSADFSLKGAEVSFASSLSQKTKSSLMFAAHNDGGSLAFDVHEAYLRFDSVGSFLNFRLGKFPIGFGWLNSQHSHSRPFADEPETQKVFFGSVDAVSDLGLELSTVRKDQSIYATLGFFEGSCAGHCHGANPLPARPTTVLHLGQEGLNFFSKTQGLWGLSLSDALGADRDHRVLLGFDGGLRTFLHEASFGDFVFRGEVVFLNSKNLVQNITEKSLGGLIWVQGFLAPHFFWGLRLGHVDQGAPEQTTWAPALGMTSHAGWTWQIFYSQRHQKQVQNAASESTTHKSLGLELKWEFGDHGSHGHAHAGDALSVPDHDHSH